MLKEELVDLIRETQRLKTEQQTVEAKAANKGCPKKLYDTLSSFSNQDEGGVILFGIDESKDFDVVGVYDAQDLQKHVSEQCSQMKPEVKALFTIAEVDGYVVVSAEIPGMDVSERPCFYEGKGRLKGSYKRVGDMDKPMTEYEIYSFEAFRKKYQDDIRTIDRCDFDTLDPSDLANYLLRLKASKPHLAALRDEQIYPLMSILKDGKVTLAAEWLFGYYPQAFAPQLCITAVKVFGEEKGALDSEGNRFEDNKRIEGTIPEMLDESLAFLRRNLSLSTKIDKQTGKRFDKFDLPIDAVREVVLNALVHRDYSIHTEGMPIQVELYSDRLEVSNPGGLYGRLTVDKLGKVQPDTRNPVLATAMEVLGLTENRYSGIPTVRRAMKQEGKPEPEFIDTGSEFRVVLHMRAAEIAPGEGLHSAKSNDYVGTAKEQQVLNFCSEPKSRREIAEMLNVEEYYAARRYINPLVRAGVLAMTLPDKLRSKDQKYIRA